MASGLLIKNGSPLVGSPIVYQLTAADVQGDCAFHRLKLTVQAFLDTGDSDTDSDFTDLTLSSPAESGETLLFDISSALRSVADRYEYTPEPPLAYPRIGYTLRACDEYMINGEVHDDVGTIVQDKRMYCIMGAYSDLERILAADGSKKALLLTRKPTTMAETVYVGDTVVVPQPYETAVASGEVTAGPTSKVYTIEKAGLQTVGGRQFFALAARPDTYQIRFVNGLGCLESVSVHSLRTTKVNITTNEYIRSIQEQFSKFSRGLVTKQNDYETWAMSSGALDEAWQSWYLHEFLMAKFSWINIGGHWIGCHIVPDDEVSGINRTGGNLLEVPFSLRLDINGSPLTSLAI